MNNNLDWKEVENKISLIRYKFDNLANWHDDLAQELRIHAYYVSDNYYDLYRKAIDFWRKLQSKQSPEIPYFDLEILGGYYDNDSKVLDQSEDIISSIRTELNREPHNKWERSRMELAEFLLDIILDDIAPQKVRIKTNIHGKSQLNHYVNKRLNLSWVAEETGIGYKRLVASMKLLEDIVMGLHAMHKIDIPIEYFRGYYKR